jgi:hypothetical protein
MIDDSPDTSWLGEYASHSASEFSIDRQHSLDCPINNRPTDAIDKLERIISHIDVERRKAGEDPQNTEWETLDESIDALVALQDELAECDCDERGDMERNQYRYFNPSFNYVTKTDEPADGLTSEEVRKYVRQDYERMESLNAGNWCFVGIRAEAEIGLPRSGDSYLTQKLSSGGLWGIESDSENSHFESVEKDELADLRQVLKEMGFSSRAISTAIKNFERKDA